MTLYDIKVVRVQLRCPLREICLERSGATSVAWPKPQEHQWLTAQHWFGVATEITLGNVLGREGLAFYFSTRRTRLGIGRRTQARAVSGQAPVHCHGHAADDVVQDA